MRPYRPSQSDPAGVWNGYVASGDTREVRSSRLEEVPEELRDAVRKHVETMFKIRSSHRSFMLRRQAEREASQRRPQGVRR